MKDGQIIEVSLSDLRINRYNRKLNRNHINRLKTSIAKDGFQYYDYIKVDPSKCIYDGAHRFVALTELGWTGKVKVIVGKYGIHEARQLNSLRRDWSTFDAICSFEASGNEHYKKLHDFMELTGLGVSQVLILLTGDRPSFENVREGTFTFPESDDYLKRYDMIESFKPHFEDWQHRSFVLAVIKVSKHPQYDHSRMMEKVMQVRIHRCADCSDYIAQLEEIYNRSMRDATRVSFNKE